MKLQIINRLILGLAIVLGAAACIARQAESLNKQADGSTLYHNGDIITMASDEVQYAEAIVQKEGKIAFVGSLEEANQKFPAATKKDLGGKALLPGFIDGHGHVSGVGFQAASANLLPAPDGEGNTVADVLRLLKAWVKNNEEFMNRTGWIVGFGYDDAQLDYYPTKEDLDTVSKDYPILIVHQSGHLGVMNSKGLEVASYDANSKDPEGGLLRRIAGSNKPNGVLEEMAFFQVLFGQMMPSIDMELELENLTKGQEIYASFGYTTAQDGRSTPSNSKAFIEAASKGLMFLDIVSYPDIQTNRQAATTEYNRRDYKNHYRIGGVKLSLDGSPQGKTAWLSKPYLIPPEGQGPDYRGYAAMSVEEAKKHIADAFENDWQILSHVNGDASVDQLIEAITEAAEKYGNDDRRAVAIHAQTTRDEQLDAFKELDIFPSFFPMHTFYWGDWHVASVLGKERAYRISPTATALKKGLRFTSHHDAPVALPSSIRVLSATVTRTSRTGDIIGPDERVSVYVALKALTDWAAWQYFEEDSKGTLEVGKLADFVILDNDPLKIQPENLDKLKVLETIKEGKTIYRRQ